VTVVRDHYVVRLEITMNDSCGVRSRQAFGGVLQESEQLTQFRSLLMHLEAQGLTIYEFHRYEVNSLGLADFVYVSDIRMIERSSGGRFLLEAPHTILV